MSRLPLAVTSAHSSALSAMGLGTSDRSVSPLVDSSKADRAVVLPWASACTS